MGRHPHERPAATAAADGRAEPDLGRVSVLILTATEREMSRTRQRIAEIAARAGLDPVFHVTGVGKCAAAAATARMVRDAQPRLCVQVGCAGAYPRSDLDVGDVAVASEEVLGDEGAGEVTGFRDLAGLGLSAGQAFGRAIHNRVPLSAPREECMLEVRRRVSGRFRVQAGRLVTVSTASGTDARAREMAERWDPIAESMEGAAAALVCATAGLPFLEIRGISNFVGDRYRSGWQSDAAVAHGAEVAAILIALELRSP